MQHNHCGDMQSVTALLIISHYNVAFVQESSDFNVAEVLQGLVSFVSQPIVTSSCTSVTRLLAHVVYMLSIYLTRPACSLQETNCSQQLPVTQPSDEDGPDNSSMLREDCLQGRSAVIVTAQVQDQAVDPVLPPQQPHRQLDTQTCTLLIHEVLEPLASRGSFEQLVCQHTIQRLRSD